MLPDAEVRMRASAAPLSGNAFGHEGVGTAPPCQPAVHGARPRPLVP
jgi:hypothetical protein